MSSGKEKTPMDLTEEELIQHWIPQFEKTVNLPASWKSEAKSLKSAADIIFQQYDAATKKIAKSKLKIGDPVPLETLLFPVWLLLAGLAIENLLKGLCVKWKPVKYDKGKIETIGRKDHNLTEFMKQINNMLGAKAITLNPENEDILNRLTAFVVWAGRYPIANKAQAQIPRKLANSGWGMLTFTKSSDQALINSLYKKLDSLIDHPKT